MAGFLESTLRSGRLGLLEAVAGAELPLHTGLLLVVDQFEEIFRYGAAPAARDDADRFVDLLLATVQAQAAPASANANPILIVLGMRSDYLGDCARFPGLPEAINDSQFLTPRMTREQYQDAICRPAKLRGARVHKALATRLCNEITHYPTTRPDCAPADQYPDLLPVLQHALRHMWTRASQREDWDCTLTLSDYPQGDQPETGDGPVGLAAALNQDCDDVLKGLRNKRDRALAQTLFRALCERTGSGRDSRRPQTCAQIADVAGLDEDQRTDLYPILRAFSDPDYSFLRVSPSGELSPESLVDISHESLIRHWAELSKWVDDETRSADEYRHLLYEAEHHGGEDDGLMRGPQLKRLLDWREQERPNFAWARRYGGEYTRAMTFLDASVRQQKRRKRDTILWNGLRAVVFSSLVLALFFAYSFWQGERAALQIRANLLAESAIRKARTDPQLGVLLALEASRATPDSARLSTALLKLQGAVGGRPLVGHRKPVNALAYFNDGHRLASAAWDGTVRIWDPDATGRASRIIRPRVGTLTALATGKGGMLAVGAVDGSVRIWDLSRPKAGPMSALGLNESVTILAFTLDGRTLAGASADGLIQLWENGAPEGPPMELPDVNGQVSALAFNADATRLAIGTERGTVGLWDRSTPDTPPRILGGHADEVTAIDFTANERWLATGAKDKTIRVWDLDEPDNPSKVLTGHSGVVNHVAFAPDGRTLASGSADQTIRLWNLDNANSAVLILRGHEGGINDLAYAPDGHTLASASNDQLIRLWDLPRLHARPEYLGPSARSGGPGREGAINALALDPDGRILASASEDGYIRLWDLTQPAAVPYEFIAGQGPVNAIAFSRNGRVLASGGADHIIRLWNINWPIGPPQLLDGHREEVTALAFSPKGLVLASASADRTIRLWDFDDPDATVMTLRGHLDRVSAIAYAPDGSSIASAGWDGRIRHWNLDAGGNEMDELGQLGTIITALAFSPDGAMLASADVAGSVRLWDPAHLSASAKELRCHESGVLALTFSRNGTTLATGGEDRKVCLWNLRDPLGEPRILDNHAEAVQAVSLAPTAGTLMSGLANGGIRLWNLDLNHLRSEACKHVGRNLDDVEWRKFLGPREPPTKTCVERPIHPSYLKNADALAYRGDLDDAIHRYRQVLNAFSSKEFDPKTRALSVRADAAPTRWDEALMFAKDGQIEQALSEYAKAWKWDPELPFDAIIENDICWLLALWGQAKPALLHCDRAIDLNPSQDAFRDSRGIARAQLGDYAGAIADFESYIRFLESTENGDEVSDKLERRRSWIDMLRRNLNPFNPQELKVLRDED